MLIPLTAVVGLTASGLVSGLTLAYPLCINPHFVDQQGSKIVPAAPGVANLSTAQRLTLWNRSYSFGAACIPVLDIVAVASFATFIRLDGTKALRLPDPKAANQLLWTAAAFLLSHIPFTLLAIKPVNDQLIALRKAANESKPVDEAKVDTLLSRWTALHNVRTTAALIGFTTAVYTLLRF